MAAKKSDRASHQASMVRASDARTPALTGSLPTRAVRPREACERYGLKMTSLYEMIRTGELPSYRVRRMRMIPVDGLEALIGNKPAAAPASANG